VRFALRGSTANRDAIGAEVSIVAGGKKQTRQVLPTRSYQSQSEKVVTFGLGKLDMVDSVTVRWPGGQEQKVEISGVDQVISVEQAGQ
jgi:hypothetical protein